MVGDVLSWPTERLPYPDFALRRTVFCLSVFIVRSSGKPEEETTLHGNRDASLSLPRDYSQDGVFKLIHDQTSDSISAEHSTTKLSIPIPQELLPKDSSGQAVSFAKLSILNNYSDRKATIVAPNSLGTLLISTLGSFSHPRELVRGLSAPAIQRKPGGPPTRPSSSTSVAGSIGVTSTFSSSPAPETGLRALFDESSWSPAPLEVRETVGDASRTDLASSVAAPAALPGE